MDKNPLYPIKRSNNILQQYMNNKVKKKSSKNKSIKSSNHLINITKKINYKFYSNYPIIRTGITFIMITILNPKKNIIGSPHMII